MPIRPALLMAALAAGLAATPALADCYDVLGCSDRDLFSRHFDYLASVEQGPTCEFLDGMRQGILAEHGPAALTRVERANLATIGRAERLKACPR